MVTHAPPLAPLYADNSTKPVALDSLSLTHIVLDAMQSRAHCLLTRIAALLPRGIPHLAITENYPTAPEFDEYHPCSLEVRLGSASCGAPPRSLVVTVDPTKGR